MARIILFAAAVCCACIGSSREVATAKCRVVTWPHILNVRDLGGMHGMCGMMVKHGMIYRSAGLNGNASTHIVTNSAGVVTNFVPGINLLNESERRIILEKTGLRTDLDLRRKDETEGMTGSPLGECVIWTNIPSFHYDKLFSSAGKTAFAAGFRVLCNEANYPVVFHCISGADRTGTFAVALLALLGVSEADIWDDWAITLKTDERDLIPIGGNLGACKQERFQSLIDGFARYPGVNLASQVESFALSCGITMDEIRNFRTIMLENSVSF